MMTPREALDQAEALLLDFDGPMAQLMPPPLNRQAADLVRQALGNEVPPELTGTTDHIALLAHPGPSHEARVRAEQAATEFEIKCAKTCDPAPWLSALLDYADDRNLPRAVVTNNSPQAVLAFLARPDIASPIHVVCGRTLNTMHELKPHPRYLLDALEQVETVPSRGLFVGDSLTDVQAGISIGIPVMGYAKTQPKRDQLRRAGSRAVIDVDEWTKSAAR